LSESRDTPEHLGAERAELRQQRVEVLPSVVQPGVLSFG
jgi:hypothetical protein